ncbi:phytanoyl-CoA dioxygenase family protein [Planosporangium sp. 12N6]|uniref:phytanoyl-CoA dioxygenase family protein n=1 Tax=Planosporangium spinosum TaxID=3402278 RepID=UPI003CEA9312
MFPRPDLRLIDEFNERGIVVVRDAIDPHQRLVLRRACEALLASNRTRGRDRGADGKDGFRGCVGLDDAFRPLVANPNVLSIIVALLSPNIHLLSSHLVALPSLSADGPRTIRTPERPGWHRDMYGVAEDLGYENVPRMAVKCAYYLTDLTPDSGITVFLPGSHLLTERPAIPAGAVDPPAAITPDIGPCDAVLFDNRTWHAGGINTSGKPRLALMMQYGYRWLARVDDPSPELLARNDLSPVERQLLGAPDRAPDGSLVKGAGAAPLRAAMAGLRCGSRATHEADTPATGPVPDGRRPDVRESANTPKEPAR